MGNTEYNKLKNAIANLRQEYDTWQLAETGALQVIQNKELEDAEAQQRNLKQTTRNSVIKCFEICHEMMWKHLKKYLEDEIELVDIPNSPKPIFRLALENNVISKSMEDSLFRYYNARINTAHDYSEKKSETALDVVEDFIEDMTELYDIIAEDN